MPVPPDAVMTSPLTAGDTTPTQARVSLVEGTTFCLSDAAGDLGPGAIAGLFAFDARVLSRWSLTVDGRAPEALSVREVAPGTAGFVLRARPLPGVADSTLLVVRDRRVTNTGMVDTVTLTNLDGEPAEVRVALGADADFADLFSVREGRPGDPDCLRELDGDALVLRRAAEPGRGLRIGADADPTAGPGGLQWRAIVPARGTWTATVTVDAFAAGEPEPAALPDPPTLSVETGHPALTHTFRRSVEDLVSLRLSAGEGRTFTAAGAPWYMTLFGRDSLLTAWMMAPFDVDLAIGTLRALADIQGRRVDPATEEQPGRIAHEVRKGPVSSKAFGGRVYYGTVDATPLFVMLLAEAARWGADPAAVDTLLPAADAALAWLDDYGDFDGDGFVEYRNESGSGLTNQGWKDSFDSVNFAAGGLARAPIALCEVQAYAYAARLARADLADTRGDGATAARWRERAAATRAAFTESFWLPDRGWFAIALDGDKRPVDSLTSNVGHLLWARVVDDERAARLIGHMGGATMDSGFGLRTLASDMAQYNPMSYHNGSVWPHDTAIAIAGLMNYAHVDGAVEVAQRLAAGLIDAAAAHGGRLPELYSGFPRGQFDPPVPYPTSCSPQAWASAAPLLVLRAMLGLEPGTRADAPVTNPRLPAAWGEVRLTTAHYTITAGH